MTVLLSGVVMSVSGPLVRLLDQATEWQFLAFRSAGIVTILLAYLLGRDGSSCIENLRRSGWTAVAAGFFLACAFTSIVFALLNTTIANTLFLASTAPFLTALLGRWFLGEQPTNLTWAAIGIAVVGALVMVVDGLSKGDWFGDVTALGAAVGFACFSVTIRHGRSRDMVPAVLYAGLISGTLGTAMALVTGVGLGISVADAVASAAYGIIGISAGLGLYVLGSRNVPAAELNLLVQGEIVLAPIWVWWGFGEVPSSLTLTGGAIILAAITIQGLGGIRAQSATPS